MNETSTISEIVELIISIVISLIVIKHFSKRRYPPFVKYHTFWPRFWSPTIDGVILWPLVTLLPLVLCYGLNISQKHSWLISAFVCLVQFAYSIYMNGRFGGSVGKLQCKLRILDSKTENPISYRQAFLRDAVPLVLILAVCIYSMMSFSRIEDTAISLYIAGAFGLWFLAEILTMLTNSKRRALHDFIAGTVVVRTNIMRGLEPEH